MSNPKKKLQNDSWIGEEIYRFVDCAIDRCVELRKCGFRVWWYRNQRDELVVHWDYK